MDKPHHHSLVEERAGEDKKDLFAVIDKYPLDQILENLVALNGIHEVVAQLSWLMQPPYNRPLKKALKVLEDHKHLELRIQVREDSIS